MFAPVNRIRSVIADCKTENDVVSSLRCHKIKYNFTTETGALSIRIPCRKGCIYIVRTCSRSAPFTVRHVNPARVAPPCYPYPVPCYSWDD